MASYALKLLLWLSLYLVIVNADPATLSFSDCFTPNGTNTTQKLSVSTVYGQVLHDGSSEPYLNLTVLGTTPAEIQNSVNNSGELSTLFTTSSVLTLSVFTNSSKFCQTLRPPSPLPSPGTDFNSSYYCPLPIGAFAFSSSIPWGANRALTTISTRLSAVDPYGTELICIDVNTTPLSPEPDNPYGAAISIFWVTVGLAIGYWVVVGIARIVSAWDRGLTRPGRNPWARAQSAGYILASAISGERLATSPALLRFCTPSMRDLIFHAQWCSALSMVAVQWPMFIYPLLTQTAWSTLSYNISITSNERWNSLSTAPYNPPSNFSDQLSDSTSVLFIDPNASNLLFTLPENATDGISSFAYTIGVRPQELFGICLTLFLAILAATIVLSLLVWFVDHVVCLITGALTDSSSAPGIKMSGTRSPAFGAKDDGGNTDENKSLNSRDLSAIVRPPPRFGFGIGAHSKWRRWWRGQTASLALSSFHGSVLHGNLVRILVLFHLPVTIFSVYQMTLPSSEASLSSRALAALSFAIISCLIPAILVIRVRLTTTNKLYEETRTLLSLGPLYNHYRHGSQMFASLLFATNLAFGITIGAAQKSGTAQAIVILVVEVISALVTTIWLPWGTGASMGLISFLFCVARIVIAVLLVILAPAISVGTGAEGWVAYGILIILALIYLAFALMLVVKIIEAVVRIVGGVSFDKSRHSVDSGLLGACGLLGCCGGPRKKSRRSKNRKSAGRSGYQQADSELRSPLSELSYPPTIGGTGKGGSIHSSGPPPSVLKPEHAFRPYKEESDDENGYIMGAWQPFQNRTSGYIPVSDSAPTTAPAATKSSGFSRVGGGRAHIDTPYAIAQNQASGSTHTFPSIERPVVNQNANGSSASLPRPRYEDESPPPSVSSNVALGQRQVHEQNALPPGAMMPFHVRTKSQTAIIEHVEVNPLANRQPGSSSSTNVIGSRPPSRANRFESGGSAPPTSYRRRSATVESDDDSSYGRSKKKWYHIRRSRAHSTEGYSVPSTPNSAPAGDSAPLDPPASATPGRSFVVIRKQQPSPAKSLQAASSSLPATPTPNAISFARDGGASPSAAGSS
ncbi:hypothetical protein GYMLUDRAFT_179150 [Collybiopsis luxurians FD-317 M1]|uniref:TRP C-terminal domain-containing protein n=1 Tax=Collybiopsis luxurians FD-317 M1 TaxID=944289 RepID=A0A0D0C5Z8_9AGAR|nr:hypothetical protein GYMLUDRAFT_179150 [Collybiopsis luxurians FD-317 M1]